MVERDAYSGTVVAMRSLDVIPLLRRLFHIRPTRRSFENPRYLLKWLLMSGLIGLVAGGGAILFFMSISFATHVLLGGIVGYLPPTPAGEGNTSAMPLWHAVRPWLLPVVTTFGGVLAGIIIFSFAPEAEGHGTDAAIEAFHQGESIRARIPLVKLVASAITIGSGGSAGREGPSAQISAGFGSLLSTLLRLNVQDRRIAIATGIGAGIGAIFRAPLGGALLAAEILYKDDLEVEVIIPALIASIVGYSVFDGWAGWSPIFVPPAHTDFHQPLQLSYYIVLGLLCGGVGVLYARGFYGLVHAFHHLKLPNWLKPGIGGLVVGLIGLVLPQALGMGYGWVQISMGTGLASIPFWVLLVLPFAKIVTTGFSIGSGGSGGVFGPGMVIGGMLGAAIWRVSYGLLPGLPATPAPFVIVGMMALFGSIAHAPLAVMLMVAEMTGNLSLLAPAMIAVGIASVLVGKNTIYSQQAETRADSPAHRLQLSVPLLTTLIIGEAMSTLTCSLSPGMNLAVAEETLAAQHVSGAPVLSQDGFLQGILTQRDIQRVAPGERASHLVARSMTTDLLLAHPEETLDDALEHLTTRHISWMPVVESETAPGKRRVLGLLTVEDIMQAYRRALTKSARRVRSLVKGTVLLESRIEPGMPLVGHPLREARLPNGCWIISLRRRGDLLFPKGSTVLQPGDMVTFLVNPQNEDRLRAYLTSADQPPNSRAASNDHPSPRRERL